jgi:hypothetical protein
MSAPEREITIEGTVLGDDDASGDVLAWAELSVGRESWSRWPARRAFAVRQDDGSRIDVDVGMRSLELFPIDTRSARYADLERDPITLAFREHAPAPHVRASLRSARVRAGDRVIVHGEVHGETQEGGSHRTPASRRVAAVRAHAIGVGPDGARELERAVARARAPRATSARGWSLPTLRLPTLRLPDGPWGHGAWLVVAGVLAALATLETVTSADSVPGGLPFLPAVSLPRPTPRAVDLAILAVDYVVVAWRLQTLHLPSFVRDEARVPTPLPFASPGGVAILATVPLIVVFAGNGDLRGVPFANGVPIVATVATIGALVLVALALREGAPSIRYARIVLAAPAYPAALPEDTWGATTGVVDDPTPVDAGGRSAAIAFAEEEVITEGSSPNIDRARLLCTDTFFVVTEDGTRVEVLPRHAAWSSAVRFRPRSGPARTIPVSTELVPDGAAIVAVGRVSRQDGVPVLRARGPESLFFYASPAGTDPRAWLRSGTRLRIAGIVAMVALALTIPALAVATSPALPAFNPVFPEGD